MDKKLAEKWLNWTRKWRKSGYFETFLVTQFFYFGGKVAIFGGKAADFERKILAKLTSVARSGYFPPKWLFLRVGGGFFSGKSATKKIRQSGYF